MNRTRWSALGAGLGLLAASALTVVAAVGTPAAAAAVPQQESEEAQRLREVELRALEEIAEQKKQFAVQGLAQAEAIAAALAREVEAAGQDRHRVAIRGPRGVVRDFSFGGSSAERVLRHAEELELTDAQRDTIRAAQKQHRRDGIEREAAIDLARLDLDELMEMDEADMDLAAVEAKLLEISRLEVQERVAELRLRRQVHETLTAEQRDQLEEMGGVFVIGDNAIGWRDGNLFLRSPGREMLFELRERMPRWRGRFGDEFPEGHWFFRHDDHADDEDEDEGEEGEGVEIGTSRRSASNGGGVITL